MTPVLLHLPKDVLEDLEEMAALLDVSSREALIRSYIGQGMRRDLERLQSQGLGRERSI